MTVLNEESSEELVTECYDYKEGKRKASGDELDALTNCLQCIRLSDSQPFQLQVHPEHECNHEKVITDSGGPAKENSSPDAYNEENTKPLEMSKVTNTCGSLDEAEDSDENNESSDDESSIKGEEKLTCRKQNTSSDDQSDSQDESDLETENEVKSKYASRGPVSDHARGRYRFNPVSGDSRERTVDGGEFSGGYSSTFTFVYDGNQNGTYSNDSVDANSTSFSPVPSVDFSPKGSPWPAEELWVNSLGGGASPSEDSCSQDYLQGSLLNWEGIGCKQYYGSSYTSYYGAGSGDSQRIGPDSPQSYNQTAPDSMAPSPGLSAASAMTPYLTPEYSASSPNSPACYAYLTPDSQGSSSGTDDSYCSDSYTNGSSFEWNDAHALDERSSFDFPDGQGYSYQYGRGNESPYLNILNAITTAAEMEKEENQDVPQDELNLLIEEIKGVQPKDMEDYELSIPHLDCELARVDMDNKCLETVLAAEVRRVSSVPVKKLCEKDRDGDTALMIVASRTLDQDPHFYEKVYALHEKLMEVKICCDIPVSKKKGCIKCGNTNPKLYYSPLSMKNNMGDSALTCAIKRGHEEVVIKYLTAGIMINKNDVKRIFSEDGRDFMKKYAYKYPLFADLDVYCSSSDVDNLLENLNI